MSARKIRKTEVAASLPQLHRALIDIVAEINRPERDAAMLGIAGLGLERALFPLLVLVERLGPIGVGELAGRVGRDYTTVSRQVARLEEIGHVTRRASAVDRRIREALITPKGKLTTDAVDAARKRLAFALFRDWSHGDLNELVRLVRKFAAGLRGVPHVVDSGSHVDCSDE